MIRITRLTDYGIVLLTRFSAAPEGSVHSARGLADGVGIPLPTVSKILKALTRAGLLVSLRGTQGGYRLARAPATISVAAVISALEGPIALTECAADADRSCVVQGRCPVRTNWQRITDAVRDALERVPLTDMTVTFPLPSAPPAVPAAPVPASAGPAAAGPEYAR